MKPPTMGCQERSGPKYCATFHSVVSRTLMRAANSIHHINKSCAIRQCGIVGKSGEPFWEFQLSFKLVETVSCLSEHLELSPGGN